jgi:transposase
MIPALSGIPPAGVRVLIATRPVDFRRGADGLPATVQSVLRQDPFCGTVFVFRSKRADREAAGLRRDWAGADLEAAGRGQIQMAGEVLSN